MFVFGNHQKENKEDLFKKNSEQLLRISKIAISHKKYERALEAIAAGAELRYFWNQSYMDLELERLLMQCLPVVSRGLLSQNNIQKETVLFYDTFGKDVRGLAIIYLRHLVHMGYCVVYVTTEEARNRQPQIVKETKDGNMIWEYIPMTWEYTRQISELQKIFERYRPATAFLYTQPFDVAGALVFSYYKDVVTRFQINLTDHAFWIGLNAFDYCIEFREYGACISYQFRQIKKEKIIWLPYYPYIDEEIPFEGFPFSLQNKKVIFSGGSLYKTLGKKQMYYKIVDQILDKHADVIFLYASLGKGDTQSLDILMKKCPKRVYHIHERKDVHQIMKHCTLYMNTYPMLGGLMTQYAVKMGKIPITLKHNNDSEGILLNQEELNIEYENEHQLLQDVDALLKDEDYLQRREKKLVNGIISETDFEKQLESIIKHASTNYIPCIHDIDTTMFRKEYIHRFSKESCILSIVKKKNRKLYIFFPFYFFCKLRLFYNNRD